jgi:hypothetical protein
MLERSSLTKIDRCNNRALGLHLSSSFHKTNNLYCYVHPISRLRLVGPKTALIFLPVCALHSNVDIDGGTIVQVIGRCVLRDVDFALVPGTKGNIPVDYEIHRRV